MENASNFDPSTTPAQKRSPNFTIQHLQAW